MDHQRELQADFIESGYELFGVTATRRLDRRDTLYYTGKPMGQLFEQMGLPVPLHAGNKRVPELLFCCPDREVAAFLSGYFDGDGHVSRRQTEISAVTKSELLARDIQRLCSRLGVMAFISPVWHTIPGKWAEPRRYYKVVASGADAAVLACHIELRHPGKRRRLEERVRCFLEGKQPSNWDIVPFPREVFRRVREGLGLTQAATGKPSAVNVIENGSGRVTPRVARQLVNTFREHDRQGMFREEIAHLELMASEDLAWDVIEEIVEVPSQGVALYDITVPGAECFIGNGLVVHNCHIYTTTTGAMKNAFGGLLNTRRHYTHSWIHATLVDLLAIQKEIHAGLCAVMDGTTAGNGPGPRTLQPVKADYLLASADQVAIDAVAAKMMGFDPLGLEYIRLAHEQGLGIGNPAEIELVGEDVSGVNMHFHVGDNLASHAGDLLWFGPLKPVQKVFFRTPLVNLFVLGSDTYHDKVWWNLHGKPIFEEWQRSSPWGRLFASY
ncbi:MAG: DUF362 domain-containing protein [Syntrophomonadaceae bacterium]|nr:DUF362 domain-containing protein [Syntrophomonadaceae bacterium]